MCRQYSVHYTGYGPESRIEGLFAFCTSRPRCEVVPVTLKIDRFCPADLLHNDAEALANRPWTLAPGYLEPTYRNTESNEQAEQRVLALAATSDDEWLLPLVNIFTGAGRNVVSYHRGQFNFDAEHPRDAQEVESFSDRLGVIERSVTRYIWDLILIGLRPTRKGLLLYLHLQQLWIASNDAVHGAERSWAMVVNTTASSVTYP